MANSKDHPDVIAFPPLILAAALAVSGFLEWLAPLGLLPAAFSAWALCLALWPIGFALGFALPAILGFRAAGTHVEPFKPTLALVESGPYRFTRNPMYIGLILLLIGIGVLGSLDWAFPIAPPFWLVLHRGVVLREEAYLSAKFGAEYDAYRARTRRWL